MVTLHEVITFLVSMQISISSLQTHNVNRCGRSRHLARKLSLRRKRSSPNVFEMAATETITSIILIKLIRVSLGFFFHDPATTEIYTLSLHDALPIYQTKASPVRGVTSSSQPRCGTLRSELTSQRRCASSPSKSWRSPKSSSPRSTIDHRCRERHFLDRKSTRLNSSH